MDKASSGFRDRDPIETVLYFLLKNWILLISLPVIVGGIAFALTLGAPRTFTASIRIPAPPVPLAGFDDLWRSPQSPYAATVSADGSMLMSHAAASEQQAREPLLAAQAATQVVAEESITAAEERQAKLSDMEARMMDQAPAPNPEALAPQVYALAVVIPIAESARQRTGSLRQWSRTMGEQPVAVSSSTGSGRIVPFAAFGAFTLALAIAIARRLLNRTHDVAPPE